MDGEKCVTVRITAAMLRFDSQDVTVAGGGGQVLFPLFTHCTLTVVPISQPVCRNFTPMFRAGRQGV